MRERDTMSQERVSLDQLQGYLAQRLLGARRDSRRATRGRGPGNARSAGPPVVVCCERLVKVDVWSDIACPWCYIGKRKFEAGVAAVRRRPRRPPVEVEYHSFELSPDTPVDFEGTEAEFLSGHKGLPSNRHSR